MYKKVCLISDEVLEIEDTLLDFYHVSDVLQLVSFVSKNKLMYNLDFIVIHSLYYEKEDILGAISSLEKFSGATVILLTDTDTNMVDHAKLAYLGENLSVELYNIIHNRNDYIKDFNIHTKQVTKLAPTLQIPQGFCMRIGVYGCMSRIGTTTNVFGLYHYFNNQGFRPLIVDSSRHILNTNMVDGIEISADEKQGYHICIYDNKDFSNVENMDLKFLVMGSKYDELLAYTRLPIDTSSFKVLASFCTESDIESLKNNIANQMISVPFVPEYVQNQGAYFSEILDINKEVLR